MEYLNVSEIRDIFLKKGVKVSYTVVRDLTRDPTFPDAIYLPGYVKPKWDKEQVERWVEDFIAGKNQNIKKED